ncbi:hypothetical protein BDP55DRAFT_683690 [Colletotrichum godetiae]|uniref:Uncharacterized protein n=1 Tax=Colletotrichum godetiae TaxID=1209918 RepID=A0AAJ0A8M3_9PEZI|nr:uncharacterized protein BDP55DRAFT_683690 [Colletotrichum godetiae]KAK1658049.1 hypothetical protein BDP55DRAFT_683690 [Colletotrichum godetiae]
MTPRLFTWASSHHRSPSTMTEPRRRSTRCSDERVMLIFRVLKRGHSLSWIAIIRSEQQPWRCNSRIQDRITRRTTARTMLFFKTTRTVSRSTLRRPAHIYFSEPLGPQSRKISSRNYSGNNPIPFCKKYTLSLRASRLLRPGAFIDVQFAFPDGYKKDIETSEILAMIQMMQSVGLENVNIVHLSSSIEPELVQEIGLGKMDDWDGMPGERLAPIHESLEYFCLWKHAHEAKMYVSSH